MGVNFFVEAITPAEVPFCEAYPWLSDDDIKEWEEDTGRTTTFTRPEWAELGMGYSRAEKLLAACGVYVNFDETSVGRLTPSQLNTLRRGLMLLVNSRQRISSLVEKRHEHKHDNAVFVSGGWNEDQILAIGHHLATMVIEARRRKSTIGWV